MDNSLRYRASKNFDKYLTEFLATGKSAGLPESRLTKEEWAELNKYLIEKGVQLVPNMYRGSMYYWFTKASRPTDKINVFNQGREELESRLIEIIQQKYPNLPKAAILNILRSDDPTDTDMIYKMLRYKQDGEYTDVSQKEFEDAFYYAITSCYNNIDLVNHGAVHHWDGIKYIDTHAVRYNPSEQWPVDKHIKMSGTQRWTWFRYCGGHTGPRVTDPNNPNGFHISLNVRVTEDLLKILDDFLIKDGGKYIDAYKFPKTNYYDEILTRHDPVTIYTNARNPELEKQIATAIQPFVRSNDGLVGDMLGRGISISPETSNANGGISVGTAVSNNIANIIRQYNGQKI